MNKKLKNINLKKNVIITLLFISIISLQVVVLVKNIKSIKTSISLNISPENFENNLLEKFNEENENNILYIIQENLVINKINLPQYKIKIDLQKANSNAFFDINNPPPETLN